MPAGGSRIDHVNRLRAGSTGRVLGFRVMAPSTMGTFLRSFTWGHVRQSGEDADRLAASDVAGGGRSPKKGVTIDLDSTISEVRESRVATVVHLVQDAVCLMEKGCRELSPVALCLYPFIPVELKVPEVNG